MGVERVSDVLQEAEGLVLVVAGTVAAGTAGEVQVQGCLPSGRQENTVGTGGGTPGAATRVVVQPHCSPLVSAHRGIKQIPFRFLQPVN